MGPQVRVHLFMIMFFMGIISCIPSISCIHQHWCPNVSGRTTRGEKTCASLWHQALSPFAIILGLSGWLWTRISWLWLHLLVKNTHGFRQVILMSLLLRLNGDQIKSGFRIYSPLILIELHRYHIPITDSQMIWWIYCSPIPSSVCYGSGT